MTYRKLFALVGSVLMLLSVLGPGAAAAASAANQDAGNLSVGVTQDGDDVTVNVTYDGSAASGANVTVSSEDSYAGTGEYVADDDGEVDLPAPENNTTITVNASYEGETASTTAELTAVDEEDDDENSTDTFGFQASSFVHELLENGTDDNKTVGQMVSDFVKENNPGNGPPEHANGAADNGQGPPEDKGNDGEKGQPDDAGNDGEKDNNGNGPPSDKGPNASDDDGDEETEEDDEDE